MKKWLLSLFALFFPVATFAQDTYSTVTEGLGVTGAYAGYETTYSLSFIIAGLIDVVLGISGIVFLILTIYAGVLYFSSAGDSDKAKKALNLIINSVIGILIVAGAWAIADFIFGQLSQIIG